MSSWCKNHSCARGYNPTLQQGSLAPQGGGGLHPHTEVREAKRDQKPSFGTTMGSYEPSLGWGGGFLLCDVSRAPPKMRGHQTADFYRGKSTLNREKIIDPNRNTMSSILTDATVSLNSASACKSLQNFYHRPY